MKKIFIPALLLVVTLAECNRQPEPYSIIDFTGTEEVCNYSKSFLLMSFWSDSLSPAAVPAGAGDLFGCGDDIFIFNDGSSQNRYQFKTIDNVLYVNDKISSIDIPDNDAMIPWFEKMKERDFSALQFINFKSEISDNYFPYLAELAKIRPDAGFWFEGGDLGEMAELLKVFNPRYIVGPELNRHNYDIMPGLTNLELLMVTPDDSVITDPLPALPSLKQIFLLNLETDVTLTNDFLVNNKQIERVIIQKSGNLDLALLNPVGTLKELVVKGADSIEHPGLINNHKSLEVLSLTGEGRLFDPDMVRLPNLRWMAFPSQVTQEEFNTFTGNHPDLEMIQIITNNTIRDLRPLSKLRKLYGLTVTDTVTDISAVKKLRNLKYLSLPYEFLEDTIKKADLQSFLPDTRIVPNAGLCLGSGWLLLIIPLVLILRFFAGQKGARLQGKAKS